MINIGFQRGLWYNMSTVKFVTVAIFWKVVMLMKVSVHSLERRSFLSVAEALGLMISFGSLIATIIFGILTAVKNDKKKITVYFSRSRLFSFK